MGMTSSTHANSKGALPGRVPGTATNIAGRRIQQPVQNRQTSTAPVLAPIVLKFDSEVDQLLY